MRILSNIFLLLFLDLWGLHSIGQEKVIKKYIPTLNDTLTLKNDPKDWQSFFYDLDSVFTYSEHPCDYIGSMVLFSENIEIKYNDIEERELRLRTQFQIQSQYGELFELSNKYYLARKIYFCNLDISQELQDTAMLIETMDNIAFSYCELGLHDTAAFFYLKGLEITSHPKYEFDNLNFHYGLGICYSDMSDYYNSIKHLKQVAQSELFQKNPELLISTYILIADANLNSYNSNDAYEYYEKALNISKNIQDTIYVNTIYKGLGSTCVQQENDIQALDFFHQSLSLCDGQDTIIMDEIKLFIGWIYVRQQKFSEALTFFNDIGNRWYVPVKLYALASVYKTLGNLDRAAEYALQAMALAKKSADWQIAPISHLLYQIYKEKKMPDKALEMFEIYLHKADSIENSSNWNRKLWAIYQLDELIKESQDSLKTSTIIDQLNQENKKRNRDRNILWISLVMSLLLISSVFFYIYSDRKKESEARLKQTSKEIYNGLDSINKDKILSYLKQQYNGASITMTPTQEKTLDALMKYHNLTNETIAEKIGIKNDALAKRLTTIYNLFNINDEDSTQRKRKLVEILTKEILER